MKKLISVFFILIISILFFGYCYFETRWIKLKSITIYDADIPDSFNGKKIIFISDIHHGPFLSIERVTKLVKQINELQPDIIFLGGDYVYRYPKYIIPVFVALRGLKSKYGVYAILGNHDHWANPFLTRKMMVRNGINICDNRSHWAKIDNDSIKIGGVGDFWDDDQIIDRTISDVEKSDFCILLSHNPDYLENLHTDLIDLSLSGHTHGGQMTLFGLYAPILPSIYGQKYRYGLRTSGEMKSYISSGVGTIIPPLRFFCRPEIVIINLKNR